MTKKVCLEECVDSSSQKSLSVYSSISTNKEKIHVNLPVSEADKEFDKTHSYFKKLPSIIETT